MSDIQTRQALIGGDNDIWGPFEQAANHLAIGANTRYLYMDGADLKLSKGMIGHTIDSSHFANISNTAARIIAVAGLTVSLWAKIELSIVAGVVNTTISSIVGANNPAILPASFTGAYDAVKGGYYEISTKRIVGLVWINAAGAVEGIINCPGSGDSYSGYATSNDTSDNIYQFIHIPNYTFTGYAPDTVLSKSASYTILNLSSNLTLLGTTGTAGIRITLPAIASNAGRTIEFVKVDTGIGALTLVPNGGTISGMAYVFLTEQYQRIKIYCDGANWFIISGVLYWISGGRNKAEWRNVHLGLADVPFDGAAGAALLIGETLTEQTSGITGILINKTATVCTLIKVSGLGYYTNDKILTGGQSGGTVVVNTATTTKAIDSNCLHNTGLDAKRFEIELWVSPNTTFTWTGATRIGRSQYSNGQVVNYDVIQIDINNLQLQTAQDFIMLLLANGSATNMQTSDYSYNIVMKLSF
jgi:hypothetical protein